MACPIFCTSEIVSVAQVLSVSLSPLAHNPKKYRALDE
jgi:hypothetical protein